jgi:hypothetical protein
VISNSKYASNFLALVFAAVLLISLIPDDALPLWAGLMVGVILGYASRQILLARLNAQSKQRV